MGTQKERKKNNPVGHRWKKKHSTYFRKSLAGKRIQMCQNEYTAAECQFYSAHSSLRMISYLVVIKWYFVGSVIFLKSCTGDKERLNNQNMGYGKHLQSTSALCWGAWNKLQKKSLSKKIDLNFLQRLSRQTGLVHRKRWGYKSHLVPLCLNIYSPVLSCLWLWMDATVCISLYTH